MRLSQTVFDDLAVLFAYPTAETEKALVRTLLCFSGAEVHERYPETHRALREFAVAVGQLSPTELEELYTRTFDINPSASLELGWHLYGERYERGAFLVLMRQQLREYGIAEGCELPDHLTHVLQLFGRMSDTQRTGMVEQYLLRGMSVLMDAWEGPENPYRRLLDALQSLLLSLCPTQQGVHADV
ncbi:MAG: molecular chaperone TorD family protein [Bacteroidia bacterium]|nr:molecular chaperone TorD family protein [Bacteroidia bacterium]